jgi:hypothetical protein
MKRRKVSYPTKEISMRTGRGWCAAAWSGLDLRGRFLKRVEAQSRRSILVVGRGGSAASRRRSW